MSSTYGIPQANPGSLTASAGLDWRTNYRPHVDCGLSYIARRHGTPCGAWGFFVRNNWH